MHETILMGMTVVMLGLMSVEHHVFRYLDCLPCLVALYTYGVNYGAYACILNARVIQWHNHHKYSPE
jgi:hypothetical protein